MVLSPFRPNGLRDDTIRRRVLSQFARGKTIRANTRASLHPTQYPWEHQKWTRTFDHQTYVTTSSNTYSEFG